MSDFINLTCPNCSGKITLREDNKFICENCHSEYLLRQNGNQASLVPQVVVNVNTNTETKSQSAELAQKMDECPICGRVIRIENSFRCRKCGRKNICIEHQDLTNFLCVECSQNEKSNNKRETKQTSKDNQTNNNKKISRQFRITIVSGFLFLSFLVMDLIRFVQGVRSGYVLFANGYLDLNPVKVISVGFLLINLTFGVSLYKSGFKKKSIVGFLPLGIFVLLIAISLILKLLYLLTMQI